MASVLKRLLKSKKTQSPPLDSITQNNMPRAESSIQTLIAVDSQNPQAGMKKDQFHNSLKENEHVHLSDEGLGYAQGIHDFIYIIALVDGLNLEAKDFESKLDDASDAFRQNSAENNDSISYPFIYAYLEHLFEHIIALCNKDALQQFSDAKKAVPTPKKEQEKKLWDNTNDLYVLYRAKIINELLLKCYMILGGISLQNPQVKSEAFIRGAAAFIQVFNKSEDISAEWQEFEARNQQQQAGDSVHPVLDETKKSSFWQVSLPDSLNAQREDCKNKCLFPRLKQA